MTDRRILAVVLALVASTASKLCVYAQHDPQRNATQAIAVGNFAKATRELAKADPTDPETHFVRMMAALKQDKIEVAVDQAQAALGAGLSFERLLAGPRDLLAPLYDTDAFKSWYADHDADAVALLHGPMLGSMTDRSASVWVRTARPATVRILCDSREFGPVTTSQAGGYVAIVELAGLDAATSYPYTVIVDEKSYPDYKLKTYPASGSGGKFNVAFGGGAGFVPQWEYMWDTIGNTDPSALLMLGDNVYIDQPEHLLAHDYCYSRRQQRPEWRRLTASTSLYSIYDDHDFATNDCVPGPEIEKPSWKRSVWNKFRENWVNPAYGGGDQQPGCWYDFHIGDVHFILLDGRYYRDLDGGSMLGPVQKAWLKSTLKQSNATFKVLASPVPWSPGVKPGSRDTWDGFADEREEIFTFIDEQSIDGVFLIAADRHRTDLRTIDRPNSYTLYEFESSRLTNRHTHKVIQTPGLIWGFSDICSFGLMRFDTTAGDPQVTFECVTIDGEVMHDFVLKASALK